MNNDTHINLNKESTVVDKPVDVYEIASNVMVDVLTTIAERIYDTDVEYFIITTALNIDVVIRETVGNIMTPELFKIRSAILLEVCSNLRYNYFADDENNTDSIITLINAVNKIINGVS